MMTNLLISGWYLVDSLGWKLVQNANIIAKVTEWVVLQ